MTVIFIVHVLKKITTITRYNKEFISPGADVYFDLHFYPQKFLRLSNVPFLESVKIICFRKSRHCFYTCLVLWHKEYTCLQEGFPGLRIQGVHVVLTELLCLQQPICLETLTPSEFGNMGITEFCDNTQNFFLSNSLLKLSQFFSQKYNSDHIKTPMDTMRKLHL